MLQFGFRGLKLIRFFTSWGLHLVVLEDIKFEWKHDDVLVT